MPPAAAAGAPATTTYRSELPIFPVELFRHPTSMQACNLGEPCSVRTVLAQMAEEPLYGTAIGPRAQRSESHALELMVHSRWGWGSMCRDRVAQRRRIAARSAAWLRGDDGGAAAAAAAEAEAAAAREQQPPPQQQQPLLTEDEQAHLGFALRRNLIATTRVLSLEYDWDMEDGIEVALIASLSVHLHRIDSDLDPFLLLRLATGGRWLSDSHNSSHSNNNRGGAGGGAAGGPSCIGEDRRESGDGAAADPDLASAPDPSSCPAGEVDEQQLVRLYDMMQVAMIEARRRDICSGPVSGGGGDALGFSDAHGRVLGLPWRDAVRLVMGLILRYRIARADASTQPHGLVSRLATVARVRHIRQEQQQQQQRQQQQQQQQVEAAGGGGGGGTRAKAQLRQKLVRTGLLPFAHGLFVGVTDDGHDATDGSGGGGGGGGNPSEALRRPGGADASSSTASSAAASCIDGGVSSSSSSSNDGQASSPSVASESSSRADGGGGGVEDGPEWPDVPALSLSPGQLASVRKESFWLGALHPSDWGEKVEDIVDDALAYTPPPPRRQQQQQQQQEQQQQEQQDGKEDLAVAVTAALNRVVKDPGLSQTRIALRMAARAYTTAVCVVRTLHLTVFLGAATFTCMSSLERAHEARRLATEALAAAAGGLAECTEDVESFAAAEWYGDIDADLLRFGEFCLGLQAVTDELSTQPWMTFELLACAAEAWYTEVLKEQLQGGTGAGPGADAEAAAAELRWQSVCSDMVFRRALLLVEPVETTGEDEEKKLILKSQMAISQVPQALKRLRDQPAGGPLQGVTMAALKPVLGEQRQLVMQARPLALQHQQQQQQQQEEQQQQQQQQQQPEDDDAATPATVDAATAALYILLLRQRRVFRPRGRPSLNAGHPRPLQIDCADPRVTASVLHLAAWRTAVEPDLPNAMDTFLVGVLPVSGPDGAWGSDGDAFRGVHGRPPHLLLSLRQRVVSPHRSGKAPAALSLRTPGCFDQVYDAVMASLKQKAPRPPVVLELFGCEALHTALAALARAQQDGLAKAPTAAAVGGSGPQGRQPPPPLHLVLQVGLHDRVRAAVGSPKHPVTRDLEAALRAAARCPRAGLAPGSAGRAALEVLLARWQAAGEWEQLPVRLVAVWEGGQGAAASKGVPVRMEHLR
ncbi:hypothetical protein PLESTF_001403700 [Pleodorina starrii]|nr:hypothetical protein PLESTM_001529800 [Pleodorina starrii]GLC73644.1 hypothetical protein PLESTF_001403700 [Pleodorina starrii]